MEAMMRRSYRLACGAMLGLIFCLALPGLAQEKSGSSKGQLVYLPVYSHIYHGKTGANGIPERFLLSALVSVRNTDPKRPIRVTSARYYNTEGKMLREFVPAPKVVPGFGTLELFVERHDESGGSGANFAIAWEADSPVNTPVIEAVHAYIDYTRSVIFTTSGKPIPAE
jgi:uncharacterized protein DUF3124